MDVNVTVTVEVDGKQWQWQHTMHRFPERVTFNDPSGYTIPWTVVDTTTCKGEGCPCYDHMTGCQQADIIPDPFGPVDVAGIRVQRCYV